MLSKLTFCTYLIPLNPKSKSKDFVLNFLNPENLFY
jgi:hypothetical protein